MSVENGSGRERAAELRELARLVTKVGFVAFGGPATHVAMMRGEVVEQRRWMRDQEFPDLNGVTNLIPVPNSTEPALARPGWGTMRRRQHPDIIRGLHAPLALENFFLVMVAVTLGRRARCRVGLLWVAQEN